MEPLQYLATEAPNRVSLRFQVIIGGNIPRCLGRPVTSSWGESWCIQRSWSWDQWLGLCPVVSFAGQGLSSISQAVQCGQKKKKKKILIQRSWKGQGKDFEPGKFSCFWKLGCLIWKFHSSFLLCLKFVGDEKFGVRVMSSCRTLMIISGIRVGGRSSILEQQMGTPLVGNRKLNGLFWCSSTRKGFNKSENKHALKPKQTKNSRTYSYPIKGDNCITFIGKFSNGPWGLDSQACPTLLFCQDYVVGEGGMR